MKVFAHVFLGEKKLHVLEFSLGEGEQTFKWLAMAIEARVRQQKILRKTFSQDSVVVLSITNDQGELFDPIDRVYEHCNSGAIDVKVSVTEQVIPHLMFSSNVLISCSHLMFSFHRHVSSHVATFR